jgi:hypothetical protein
MIMPECDSAIGIPFAGCSGAALTVNTDRRLARAITHQAALLRAPVETSHLGPHS